MICPAGDIPFKIFLRTRRLCISIWSFINNSLVADMVGKYTLFCFSIAIATSSTTFGRNITYSFGDNWNMWWPAGQLYSVIVTIAASHFPIPCERISKWDPRFAWLLEMGGYGRVPNDSMVHTIGRVVSISRRIWLNIALDSVDVALIELSVSSISEISC